jgi:F-type H+-transporting ATPase subunit epsilon
MADSTKTFYIEIVTPEKAVFQGDALSVTVPGELGSFQVLKNHASILSSLEKGNLKIKLPDATEKLFVITGGFFEFSDNKGILLAEGVQ